MMERIHVTVRARPLSPGEANNSPWIISSNSIVKANSSTVFNFDRVFGEGCNTADVYAARTKDIVSAAVRGFNGTVFAYGQTSSGKTHTMLGSETEPGVILLAVQDLFDAIKKDVDREFVLKISYMDIYFEKISDLLNGHTNLHIHEHAKEGIRVAGLSEEIVHNYEDVCQLIKRGESRRHTAKTNMNQYSSRSHAIFHMVIESWDKSVYGVIDGASRVSVLNLVDLAGSERQTGAEGYRLQEGSMINRSLLELRRVITTLSEGARRQAAHVPYRNSVLTRVLQPALGGNANTAIICTISLAQVHEDDTKSSLEFASTASQVTNCARVTEVIPDGVLINRQKKEIEDLHAKLAENRKKLDEKEKALALSEKELEEKNKIIAELSSSVPNMDQNRNENKKRKRADNLSQENLPEFQEEQNAEWGNDRIVNEQLAFDDEEQVEIHEQLAANAQKRVKASRSKLKNANKKKKKLERIEKVAEISATTLERKTRREGDVGVHCRRCDSTDTTFRYFNNYNIHQERFFCKGCGQYWTKYT